MTIVATWLMHSLLIASLLGAGAFAWELSARWTGRQARWGWVMALAGAVTLPWLLRLVPEQVSLAPRVPVLLLDPVMLSTPVAATSGATWSATDAGIVVWLVLSVLMLAYVASMLVRLARVRRRWRAEEVSGEQVLVTRNTGPAAIGIVRGMVVVPAWALELDADLRALLLRHEREHVHAGDPRLLLASLLLVAAMPWNPLVWLMMLRLRNAIELDCDARVLRSGVDPRRYGSLLLEVGRRRSSSPLVMATFAEPRVFLEERIRRIARWPLQRRPVRGVVFALAALVLCATALSARVRITTAPVSADAQSANVLEAFGLPGVQMEVQMAVPLQVQPTRMAVDTPPAIKVPAEVLAKPTFTPMTKRPELVNPADVQNALAAMYPATLRDAGIGGGAVVWFLIDGAGTVVKTQLSKTSGYPALDEAALGVAAMMRFSPAYNRDVTVPAWIEIPILFTSKTEPKTKAPELIGTYPTPAPNKAELKKAEPKKLDDVVQGVPTVMKVRPEMLNAAEVMKEMVRAYPPLLRDAGIGGVTVIAVFVSADGRVLKTQVMKSSGYPALDEAALRLAPMMKFSPAIDGASKVEAWVEVPLVFSPDNAAPVTYKRELPPGTFAVEPLRTNPPTAPTRSPHTEPSAIPLAAQPLSNAPAGPTFTPMTVRPELLNTAEIQRALVRAYPPTLRDAGIGGRPVVWFFINDDGTVGKVQLSKSSGYPALDEAALIVASQMRFSPPMNRDKKVSAWIEIPIVFTAK